MGRNGSGWDRLAAVVGGVTPTQGARESREQGEGPLVGKLIGLEDVRATLAMMRSPDGHAGIELDKFHTPNPVRIGRVDAPENMTHLRAHGAEPIGEMQYEDTYLLANIRGPVGIIVGLSKQLGNQPATDVI